MAANPLTNNLSIKIFETGQEAVDGGAFYREPDFKPIELVEAIVVLNGTQNGNSTVDFVLKDATGQKFVFMITGNLLKSIPA